MKWYFGLNEESLTDQNYVDLLHVAVSTARTRTTLRPMFLYDGGPNRITESLIQMGVTIVPCRTRFIEQIHRRWRDNPGLQRIASGAFLRLEIPLVEQDDEYVLYTDCDVQFLSDPKLSAFRPEFFAAAPEIDIGNYEQLNSGVLLLNTRGMMAEVASFSAFVDKYFDIFEVFDQSALTIYFANKFDYLPATLNWKPYWGKSHSAEILHFHLKPHQIRAFEGGSQDPGLQPIRYLYEKTPEYAVKMAEGWSVALATARANGALEAVSLREFRRRDLWPQDFDGELYLRRYPDVAAGRADPYLHYVTFGKTERRIWPAMMR